MEAQMAHDHIDFSDPAFPVVFNLHKKLSASDGRVTESDRWHEQAEIKLFYAGEAVIEVDSRILYAGRGDIVVINPGERHNTYALGEGVEYTLMMVDLRFLSERSIANNSPLQKLMEFQIKFNNLIRGNERVDRALHYLLSETENQESETYLMALKGLLINFFAQMLASEVQEVAPLDVIAARHNAYSKLTPAISHIISHFSEDITIEELAQKCLLSPSYFCRLFKTVAQNSPISYLNDYRLSYAEHMIQTTDAPISEIAHLSGFTDECYFSRLYKLKRGATPSSLRKQKA